jgi:hypothetical protein
MPDDFKVMVLQGERSFLVLSAGWTALQFNIQHGERNAAYESSQ